jgi:ATP-dependent Clp protease protease subunit
MPVTQEQNAYPPPLNGFSRTLYISGEVDSEIAHNFIVALESMDRVDGDIRIVLNSNGGDEQDGYAMHDAITMCRNKVTIDGYGSVMSIAAAIFQAGDVRRMAPNADFMVHHGSIEAPDVKEDGTVEQDQVVAMANNITRNTQRYYAILSSGSQQPEDIIAIWCKDETTFNAQEAVDAGFADSIIEPLKTKIPKKKKRSRR